MSSLRDLMIADGATHLWLLNETGGTNAADSEGSLNGTYSGVTLAQSVIVKGTADKAASFTTGSFITVPNAVLADHAAKFTVEHYFQLSAVPGGGTYYGLSEFQGSSDSFRIFATGDGSYEPISFGYSTFTRGGINVPLDTLSHQLIVCYDGTGGSPVYTAYFDGVSIPFIPFSSGYSNLAQQQIGRFGTDGAQSFRGLLSYTGVYVGGVLSADQALSHHKAFRALKDVNVATTIDGAPGSRVVRLYDYVTGTLLGQATTSSGGSAVISVDGTQAVIGVAYDDYGDFWSPTGAYGAGSKAFPTSPNGHWYKTTSGGSPGSSEPVWPIGGGTVTDGTIIWTDMGTMRAPDVQGPFVP